jgi:hypothetical protein
MPCITLILGAGASRGVSYAHPGRFPSPLDSDFFDLLQRLKPHPDDHDAVRFVLEQVTTLPPDFRRSMERSFYTLYLRAFLKRILSNSDAGEDDRLLGCFAHAVEAVLRFSHKMETCEFHKSIVAKLGGDDAVISFNYDLVIERALRPLAEVRNVSFGDHIYRFAGSPAHDLPIPKILKLHGSSHWKIREGILSTRILDWKEFDKQPQYIRHKLGPEFPILLPFWDKAIQHEPWLHLWRESYQQLQRCDTMIVWGYSLPPTDVKARELFSIAAREHGKNIKLCVIDPSVETRGRWQELYPRAQYCQYQFVEEFLENPPYWWDDYGTTDTTTSGTVNPADSLCSDVPTNS